MKMGRNGIVLSYPLLSSSSYYNCRIVLRDLLYFSFLAASVPRRVIALLVC